MERGYQVISIAVLDQYKQLLDTISIRISISFLKSENIVEGPNTKPCGASTLHQKACKVIVAQFYPLNDYDNHKVIFIKLEFYIFCTDQS